MATQNGTITGATLVSANLSSGTGTLKSYLLTVDFPAYTGSTDTATITGVGAAIATYVRNGKTNTLKAGICASPGLDTAAQLVFATGAAAWAMTVSSDDLTGNLSVLAGTEITATTATTGVAMLVVVAEA